MKHPMILLGAAILSCGIVGAVDAAPIKVCTGDWPPYTIGTPGSKDVTGSHTDLVREALKRLGLDPQIEMVPWERCLKDAEAGRYDVVYSASFKPDRAAYALYPKQPLQSVSYVALVAKGAEHGWTAERNAAKLPQPIGSPLGFSVTADLKKQAGVTVDDSGVTDLQDLQKLIAGRVKTAVMESSVARRLVEKLNAGAKIEFLDPPVLSNKDYYVIVSKKYGGSEAAAQEFTDRLDAVLTILAQEGFLATISEKYTAAQ